MSKQAESPTSKSWREQNATLAKRWHLSTLQLSLILAVNGAFWLIVGLLVSVRILL